MKFIQVEFSAIVMDVEKSNRFGKMLLLDVPDEKLLSLAKEIPEEKKPSAPMINLEPAKIDITEP